MSFTLAILLIEATAFAFPSKSRVCAAMPLRSHSPNPVVSVGEENGWYPQTLYDDGKLNTAIGRSSWGNNIRNPPRLSFDFQWSVVGDEMGGQHLRALAPE